jgi:hypothetical protein
MKASIVITGPHLNLPPQLINRACKDIIYPCSFLSQPKDSNGGLYGIVKTELLIALLKYENIGVSGTFKIY